MAKSTLISHEALFAQLDRPPIIANSVSMITKEDQDNFNKQLFVEYESDTLVPEPQCGCGNLKGLFHVGETCEVCGDVVRENFKGDIDSTIWLRPLEHAGLFLTPVVFAMFRRAFMFGKHNAFDGLKWLLDTYYKPTGDLPAHATLYLQAGHQRGNAYFSENFDKAIRDFILLPYTTTNKELPEKLAVLLKMIDFNRDKIFTSVLPVPNSVMFPVEKTGTARFGDKSMISILDGVNIIQDGESMIERLSIPKREMRMFRCMESFVDFHYSVDQRVIGGKNGGVRQHVFGGRLHATSRAVITSIYNPHDFKEVHFPWVVFIEQFQLQIANKLIRRGYSLEEIHYLLKRYARDYSPLMDEIFKELIDESPHIGLPIILQRNPTIRRGSAILVYITKVKSNTQDFTIAMSVGNLTGMNADRFLPE